MNSLQGQNTFGHQILVWNHIEMSLNDTAKTVLQRLICWCKLVLKVNICLESHFIYTKFRVVKGLVLDQPRSWYITD